MIEPEEIEQLFYYREPENTGTIWIRYDRKTDRMIVQCLEPGYPTAKAHAATNIFVPRKEWDKVFSVK